MTKYLLIITSLIISLTACTPHKITIEQGNILKPKMIKQLEVGMSKSQVEFIMGTPLIKDTFNGDRWDYVYNIRPNQKYLKQKNLSLIFDNGNLASLSGSALDNVEEDIAATE
ncbi:MAG: outer membrane protein assembly factor BamE [Pseudohongiellaceae bacterium]|jgi:outer membrane protein assembly factor BamE